MSRFAGLNRAQLSYEYLHTNSTTHEFLFGAIVEMIDNSKDAGASTCAIYTVTRPQLRGGRILCFLDDGCGMSPEEAHAMTTFGYSAKRRDPNMIGQYGNGLKSGAMRVGKDMIVFTKKGDAMTCIFLSRTFHDEEAVDEIIVPTPSFTLDGQPLAEDMGKHELEMELIHRYSPFQTMADLKEQFNLIKNRSGTLVLVYNLKLLENGNPELDFESDQYDIRLSDPDGGDKTLVPERSSLRAYLAVLYSTPHMKLYLNGKKVRTRNIVAGLFKPRQYKFSSNKFKLRAEQQIQQLKENLSAAQEHKKEADMKLKDFERKHTTNPVDKESRAQLRKLQDEVQLKKQEIARLKENTNVKIKQLAGPKTLTFMFGMNLDKRWHDGCFVYNNGRLIKMYEKAGPQTENGLRGRGVVGIVDVPFTVMEPTHNKQDFADSREYRQLIRSMGEHMEQYWRDLNPAGQPGGLVHFWEQFGYTKGTSDWLSPASTEEKFVKKRLMSVNITLQCDACLKWRVHPYDSRCLKDGWPPDSWTCKDNPDPDNNKCQQSEKTIQIPSGKLEKESATVEQRREQLEKKIEKQQAEVQKLAGLTTVRSRRDLAEAERKRKEQEAAAAAAAVAEAAAAAKRKSLQTKRPPPTPVRAPAKSASPAKPTRKRPKTPSPPPSKKPRTKAELRKQMQKAAVKESEDEDSEFEVIKGSPTKRQQARSPPPLAPLRRNARKSIAISRAEWEEEEPVAVAVPAKKVVATRVEAHSTANGDNDLRSPASATSDGQPSSSDALPSASKGGDSSKRPSSTESAKDQMTKTADILTSPKDDFDDLAFKNLKKCLFYFLPPNYKYTKKDIEAMSKKDILAIELPDFFQAYEKGLKKIVSEHVKESEEANRKLRQLKELCVEFAQEQGVELPKVSTALPGGVDEAMKVYLKNLKSE